MRGQFGQRPAGQRRGDVPGGLLERGRRHAVQQHEPQDHVRGHAGTHRQHGICPICSVGHDHVARREDGEVQLQVRAERDLDDPVDGPERFDFIGGGRLPVVHDQVGAGAPGQVGLLLAAHRRHDPGAEEFGQLDRVVTHRPCAAGHQDRLAIDGPVGEQAAVRGHRGHAQARAELERGVVRQRHRPIGRDDGPFRRRSPATPGRCQPGPYPLANPALVHSLADRVDHACAVVVRDLEAVDRTRRGSAARLPVGRVDTGEGDLDPDLAGTRLRAVDVLHPQHLSARAEVIVERSSHGFPVWPCHSHGPGSHRSSHAFASYPGCGRPVMQPHAAD